MLFQAYLVYTLYFMDPYLLFFAQRACNPKSQIPTIFSTFFKSQKWSAQNEAIFGGQNQKNAKKIFKNFYCPKSSEISYWSIIYL